MFTPVKNASRVSFLAKDGTSSGAAFRSGFLKAFGSLKFQLRVLGVTLPEKE
jgi:hypothetical protein